LIHPLLTMLTFIACNHIDRLLNEVKVVLLIGGSWREIKISINKILRAGIEKSVDIALVPAALFYWLKFRIKII